MRTTLTLLGRGLAAIVLAVSGAAIAAGVGGCGSGATGGSEAGNPSRSVVGVLAASSEAAALTVESLHQTSSQSGCPADVVVAVDSRKRETTATVGSDCSFALELPFNKAYSVRFRVGDNEVGSMIFNNSPERFDSPVMEISEHFFGISLGVIPVDGAASRPENEPSIQNDADLDGVDDYEDPDDDNDGILDVDEPDCDLDGIIDDYDDLNTNCPPVKTLPENKILEVLPRKGAGITSPEDAVPLDQTIEARFSCPVDPDSLNSETFVVTAKDAPDNYLQCDILIAESGTTAACQPLGLAPSTVYRTTIQSVRCEDGSAIASTTWEWKTTSISDPAALPITPSEKVAEP